MSKWGYNHQPRCRKCGRFITREGKSRLCDNCFEALYQQIGKIPDKHIPREVIREYRYQQAKRQVTE